MQSIVKSLLIIGLTTLLCGCVSAQWHFSNGWQSGKRSSFTACQFRPQVKALISRIIDEELTRLQRVCSRTPFPIDDTRSPYIQNKSPQSFEPDQ